ncbi:putative amidoligase [Lasiosphaeria miniovina]|uniref:Amidoligase n=1 Tax=Lasiosphaeria miniovina TaxID=1954250 RepID=A0AA40DHN0_9PEZI|nr:putative amidoligase [Lasiosphaeria miniovina]KAK0703909.1 putative amidoligase [Lasiosphaeria miniovina]
MASQNAFQFGVEIELLLGSRKKAHGSWKALAKDLSKRLAKAGVANHVNEANDKSPDNYREWSIAPEVTIPSQPAKNLFGLELVSPVYPVYAYWAADLDAIFATLRASFTLTASPHCSTHVHVSRAGARGPLSATDLAALAKAALYYEPALDVLVPAGRRGTAAYWCQSNRANPALAGRGLAECLAVVDAVSGDARAVVEAVNLFPAGSAYGRAHGKLKDFVRGKVYKWDFTGMLQGGGGGARGTVEFRQAPGSLVADDAAAWVTLAVAFVVGATAVGARLGGPEVDVTGGAGPDELWALLAAGAEALGWESLGAVEGLFARRA